VLLEAPGTTGITMPALCFQQRILETGMHMTPSGPARRVGAQERRAVAQMCARDQAQA